MKKERDTTIDIGKGLCIYLMVLGHCLFYGNVHHVIYLFHMPFFFFVSGFFLKVNSDWSVFFVQKTKRLLLPLGIYWIFATIIKVLENILGKHQIEFVFADIGPLWFLISLWTIFMLSYITIKLTKYVKWIWGGIIILPLIGYLLVSQNIRCPLYLVQSLIMFPMFLLGYICYNISLPWKRNNTETVYSILASNRIFVLIFSFVALCSYIYVPFGNLDLSSLQLPSAFSLYTAALFGIILVFTVAKMLSKCLLLKNMLTIMGSKSYAYFRFPFSHSNDSLPSCHTDSY